MKKMKVKPESIDEFQDYLENLYEDANENKSAEYLFSYLFRNMAYLSRVIGEDNGDSKINFIKSISWLLTLASKFGVSLEESFVKKYPGICPYCLTKPCNCAETGKKPVEYIPEYKAVEELEFKFDLARRQEPKLSMDMAVKTINSLYPSNKQIWRATGPKHQFYRILEELGEVHEAYTSFLNGRKNLESVSDELADVFAWTLSVWENTHSSYSLNDAIIDYYYEGCPVCRLSKCECPDYSDRGERLAQVEQLVNFKNKILELVEAAPKHADSLNEISKSIEVAAEKQTTSSAIRSVGQAESKIEQIAKELKPIADTSKNANTIVSSIMNILNSMNFLS